MPKRSEPTVPTLAFDAPPAPSVIEAGEDAVARFEQEMQELETIVGQMEKGDLRLEDSLKLFERGTALARSCRKSLDTAELKVRNLLEASDSE
jgi:exodeoxyribonuclease VII small subunit